MRLNKWLVLAGVASSRRKADELIAAGRILRNGHVAEAGEQALVKDSITMDGENLRITAETPHIITFYKPRGVISSHARQGSQNKIVFDYLPLGLHRDIIVGRLDRESEGLMLLTNDGGLAHELMHPSFGVQRVYRVTTKQPLTNNDLSLLVSGVELNDGMSRAVAAVRDGDRRVLITLEEGRNRQIRRTLDALGHSVTRLVRIQHGAYAINELQPGEWREIILGDQA